jgi:hypothetical protein
MRVTAPIGMVTSRPHRWPPLHVSRRAKVELAGVALSPPCANPAFRHGCRASTPAARLHVRLPQTAPHRRGPAPLWTVVKNSYP